jgi:hypothetical protein
VIYFEDTPRAIAALARIDAVPTLLKVMCDITGLRLSAVARATEGDWRALALYDGIGLGLAPGERLRFLENAGVEDGILQNPVVIERAGGDPNDRTPHSAMRTFESFM